MYIFTITYNFDGSSVAKKCETMEEAIKTLHEYLDEEVNIIKNESEYEPSVLDWSEDDVVLVYAEGYTKEQKIEIMHWKIVLIIEFLRCKKFAFQR